MQAPFFAPDGRYTHEPPPASHAAVQLWPLAESSQILPALPQELSGLPAAGRAARHVSTSRALLCLNGRADQTLAARCPLRRRHSSAHAAEDSATPSAGSSGPARRRVVLARAALGATHGFAPPEFDSGVPESDSGRTDAFADDTHVRTNDSSSAGSGSIDFTTGFGATHLILGQS